MPCYEPPPEWAGAAATDGQQAAKLLCGIVGGMLAKGERVSLPLMRWYVGHRHVDLRMMADPRMRNESDDPERVKREIAQVEALIEKEIDRLCQGMGSLT